MKITNNDSIGRHCSYLPKPEKNPDLSCIRLNEKCVADFSSRLLKELESSSFTKEDIRALLYGDDISQELIDRIELLYQEEELFTIWNKANQLFGDLDWRGDYCFDDYLDLIDLQIGEAKLRHHKSHGSYENDITYFSSSFAIVKVLWHDRLFNIVDEENPIMIRNTELGKWMAYVDALGGADIIEVWLNDKTVMFYDPNSLNGVREQPQRILNLLAKWYTYKNSYSPSNDNSDDFKYINNKLGRNSSEAFLEFSREGDKEYTYFYATNWEFIDKDLIAV